MKYLIDTDWIIGHLSGIWSDVCSCSSGRGLPAALVRGQAICSALI